MVRTELDNRFPFKISIDDEFNMDDFFIRLIFRQPLSDEQKGLMDARLQNLLENWGQKHHQAIRHVNTVLEWGDNPEFVDFYVDARDLNDFDPWSTASLNELFTEFAMLGAIKEVKVGDFENWDPLNTQSSRS